MKLTTFTNPTDYLDAVRPALEAAESANNLMYGLSLRLQTHPERIQTPPYYAVVREGADLKAALIMTPPFNIVVLSTSAQTSTAAFDLAIADLRAAGWNVPGVLGPNEAALAFAQAWQRASGEPHHLAVRERVYELRQVLPPPQPAGSMRPATLADLDLATQWSVEFTREAVPDDPSIDLEQARESMRLRISDGDIFLWVDGEPVALAGRTRPTPHGWTVGPVYTPKHFRRKGYATALVAGLSQIILDSGKSFATLFTDLSNPISNSIYMKVGYVPVCDFNMYRFQRQP